MPVIIPEQLPATQTLKDHGIFVMGKNRATAQDIRPVKICILNLMPDKITTETQLLGKLSNSMLHVDVTLLAIESHISKNTSQKHLDSFYSFFSQIKDQFFDGIIITGAPIEHLPFEDVSYWDELTQIFDWTKTNAFTSLFICWASQAALYHFYGIPKLSLDKKLFGVYPHIREDKACQLFLGMGDEFYVPHSRNTSSDEALLRAHTSVQVLASSKEAGIHLAGTPNKRRVFMSGHPEYDSGTLEKEYLRDVSAGQEIAPPQNYYSNDNPHASITTSWKSDASIFYLNWLNYYVYQETEYFLSKESLAKRDAAPPK